MAKVKTTFSAKAVEHPMQNGKDNVLCKEWNTIEEIQKQERWL
jgi:hypothetical protein